MTSVETVRPVQPRLGRPAPRAVELLWEQRRVMASDRGRVAQVEVPLGGAPLTLREGPAIARAVNELFGGDDALVRVIVLVANRDARQRLVVIATAQEPGDGVYLGRLQLHLSAALDQVVGRAAGLGGPVDRRFSNS